MTAPELADTWCPVPIAWRLTLPGDVITGTDGQLHRIDAFTVHQGRTAVHLAGHPQPYPIDLETEVRVLVPVTERDAYALSRAELAAQVIARRTAA